MTTQEIKVAGFRLFEATMTAMMNVANGCYSDQEIVDRNMPRLEKMAIWFKENDLMADFSVWSANRTLNGGQRHFYVTKLINLIF